MRSGTGLIEQMNSTPIIPNSLALWGLGQMGLAVKGPDGILYIDAYLTDTIRQNGGDWWTRAYDPPLRPDQVTNATAILASHEHGDHLDPATAGPMAQASPHAPLIVTGWSRAILDEADIPPGRVIVPRAHEPLTIPNTGARLTALPSAHYEVEDDAEKGHRWFGFLIEWNGVVLYHSGDTVIYGGYVEMLRRYPTADVAMLATNGRDWYRESDVGAIGNLWPAEAARLARDMGWGVVIPGHNDLFPNNGLSNAGVAEAFERYAPRQAYKILQPGELYYFVK